MGAVTVKEMLALEAAAFAEGWTEEALLDAAGTRLGQAIGLFFPQAGTAVGYLGKGHNAGDALVALRVLRDRFGWKVAIRSAFPPEKHAPLVTQKWLELGCPQALTQAPAWPVDRGPLILLDGLLGTGVSGNLREPVSSLAAEMAQLRQEAGARVVAVDCPSGIDLDSGDAAEGAVVADVTFMIGSAKQGLLTGGAASRTGALALVPVPVLASTAGAEMELISPQTQGFGKGHRDFDFHKGRAGRVAILAGSENYMGAAVMASIGALRGGAGLVTLFVPDEIKGTISGKCPPEVIIRKIGSPEDLLDERFDALVCGCGLGDPGEEWTASLMELISRVPVPAVIDADALNLMVRSGRLEILNGKHVITPHPGEFRRLAPDLAELPREQAARGFVERFSATLLLKGSRTIVTARGTALRVNSTGSPGMATGGQGDLLAGVIGALLAGGEVPIDAASLGAWLCGRASEVALDQAGVSEESLLPTDTAAFLGRAFGDWKAGAR